MKNSRFVLIYASIIILAVALFSLMHQMGVWSLPQKNFFIIIGTIIFAGILGLIIMNPLLVKNSEQFVGRFLILTTVQMLAVMSILMAFWYSDKTNLKASGLQLVSVFIFFLLGQSILLIQSKKN